MFQAADTDGTCPHRVVLPNRGGAIPPQGCADVHTGYRNGLPGRTGPFRGNARCANVIEFDRDTGIDIAGVCGGSCCQKPPGSRYGLNGYPCLPVRRRGGAKGMR